MTEQCWLSESSEVCLLCFGLVRYAWQNLAEAKTRVASSLEELMGDVLTCCTSLYKNKQKTAVKYNYFNEGRKTFCVLN
jgi:hypothetical protein